MPKRKDAEMMDERKQREVLLSGISDRTAVQLYDACMEQLQGIGRATFAAGLLLREAAQWTATINEIQMSLRRAVAADAHSLSIGYRSNQILRYTTHTHRCSQTIPKTLVHHR